MSATVDTELLGNLGLYKSDSPAAKKSDDSLAQSDFLKLMITQLQYQDPFQPMENGEFLGQMAQFSTVSGIQDLQKSFEGFAQSVHSSQALQAASMVDRSVLVPGKQITLDPEYGQMGAVDLPASASEVTVGVYSQSGQLVRQIALGPQPPGTAEFVWDGLDNAGNVAPPGTYEFRAQAAGAAGEESLEMLLASRVSSVSVDQGGGGLVLHVQGLGEVDFSQVRRIG